MDTRKEGKFMSQGKQGQEMAGHGHANMQATMMKEVPEELQNCIKECLECSTICRDTITYCLLQGGQHAQADHILLMMDCAEICETSAHFMMHNSPVHHATCGACTEVCERCAEECGKMSDDQMMRQCADTCRRCAESCRKMVEA